MKPLLELREVDAYYGLAHILRRVSLEVGESEVVVLLGRNGAGKSTTLKTVMGLVRAARGHIRFDGLDIHQRETHEIARLGLGYVPEERRIFSDLTVLENLAVGRRPAPGDRRAWTVDRVLELFPGLGALRGRLGGQLSGGEQQMLTIGRTLMGNPRLILLDEPAEGLAPIVVEQLARGLGTLKEEGMAILLSEQNLGFSGAIGGRALILEQGQIRYRGTLSELSSDGSAGRAFLDL